MAVTSADVLRIAPELASLNLTDADWTSFIGDAALQVNPTYWGTKTDLGVKWLTAHLVALSKPNLGRVLTAQSVGQVSQSFAAPAAANGDSLDATRFGAEFKRLRRSLGQRLVVP